MQILPDLHHIPGIIANTFLIIDPDGLTLVDCGLPRSKGKILHYIEQLGFKVTDLKRILITHADIDHVGSLTVLQRAASVRVFASAPETIAITDGRTSRPLKLSGLSKWLLSVAMRIYRVKPARVDEVVYNGQELPIMGGLQVLETLGHTPGHISYYSLSTGVLFCGDSLRVIAEKIEVSRGFNTWDEEQALQSARLQAALGARLVCAGHGEVLRDEAGVQFPSLPGSFSSQDANKENS